MAHRLLFASTDPGARAVLAVALASKYHVRTAGPARSLHLLGCWRPRIIVADLDQSDLGPERFLEAVHMTLPMSRLVVVAGSGAQEAIKRTGGLRVNAVLTPPLDIGELLDTVWMLSSGGAPGAPRPSATFFVHRGLNLLARQPTRPLTASELAGSLGVSARHLARSFRRVTGMSATRFGMLVRVELAKVWLEQDDLKLSVIAERSGFFDAAHLSRAFRLHARCTPGEHRRLAGQVEPARAYDDSR